MLTQDGNAITGTSIVAMREAPEYYVSYAIEGVVRPNGRIMFDAVAIRDQQPPPGVTTWCRFGGRLRYEVPTARLAGSWAGQPGCIPSSGTMAVERSPP